MDLAAPQTGWSPSGIVTLTTDFGLSDPYVGIMKGVLQSVAAREPQGAQLRAVDLTHGIAPQAVRTAAFHLEHSWRYFPPGTVHLAVVDPGVGSEREILVCALEGQVLIAPDNGLLDPILSSVDAAARCFRLDLERVGGPAASHTFHGRDLFAPLAAHIALGMPPEQAGPETADWVHLEYPRPVPGPEGELLCEVLLADGFGNLITSARAADLEGPPSAWICEVGAARFPLAVTYAEGAPDELLALVDSFGFWEVAVRDGDAAGRLVAGPGTPVVFRRKG